MTTGAESGDERPPVKVRPMVETDHEDAHRIMRMAFGVAMHRPDESGYHRPDALVVDDWR